MWHPWGPSFGAVGKRQGEGWRGAVGFGGQQRQARAPAWPTLAAWGAMESSRGLPRYRPPPPSLRAQRRLPPSRKVATHSVKGRLCTCGLLGLCGTLSGWGEWSWARTRWDPEGLLPYTEPGRGVQPGRWCSLPLTPRPLQELEEY